MSLKSRSWTIVTFRSPRCRRWANFSSSTEHFGSLGQSPKLRSSNLSFRCISSLPPKFRSPTVHFGLFGHCHRHFDHLLSIPVYSVTVTKISEMHKTFRSLRSPSPNFGRQRTFKFFCTYTCSTRNPKRFVPLVFPLQSMKWHASDG